jgi:hypothetical protein
MNVFICNNGNKNNGLTLSTILLNYFDRLKRQNSTLTFYLNYILNFQCTKTLETILSITLYNLLLFISQIITKNNNQQCIRCYYKQTKTKII